MSIFNIYRHVPMHFRFFLIIMMLILSVNAASQEIQEVRPISFGSVVILDNASPGSINIDFLGNVTISTHFGVIETPLYGIFRLVDYPAHANLFLTGGIIQGQTTSIQFSPEQFTLTNVNLPASVRVESDGTVDFRAGGRIVTSGSGSTTFADTTYTSRLIITVNF